MKIRNKNIRATAIEAFWGDKYTESIYLWEGAKHKIPLSELLNSDTPALPDLFSTLEENKKAHEFCKSYYHGILPLLAKRLNKIHGLDLSISFWQTAFGYWLYRHISIAYEKFIYLNCVDVSSTDIKVLSTDSFYIPQNHYDYFLCFTHDFGVQQLTSHYYHLFSDKKNLAIRKDFTCDFSAFVYPETDALALKDRKRYSETNREPQIAILNVYLTDDIVKKLHQQSNGLIETFLLPPVPLKPSATDCIQRKYLAESNTGKRFDRYFLQTLQYCLPKNFLENFKAYYSIFDKDIDNRKFSHIVAECWISNIPDSIYVALAKEKKRVFIAYEHGFGSLFYDNNNGFICTDCADLFMTVGCRKNTGNVVPGGFACRKIHAYENSSEKKMILFVSHTNSPYWLEFNVFASNSTFVKELTLISDFIKLLPPELKKNFRFRPRVVNYFWDTAAALELNKKDIKIDTGTFSESIHQAKIVIIDHISTGIAEILLSRIPFILLNNISVVSISKEYAEVFEELRNCRLVHDTPESALSHLSLIYEDVDRWWKSEIVQCSVNKLIDISLAPASETTSFLLALLDKNNKNNILTELFYNKKILKNMR